MGAGAPTSLDGYLAEGKSASATEGAPGGGHGRQLWEVAVGPGIAGLLTTMEYFRIRDSVWHVLYPIELHVYKEK